MTQLIKYVVGIDIAKDKFDACLVSLDVSLNCNIKSSRLFTNNATGFKDLLQWIGKYCKENVPVETLMEASGVYHEKLAIWLTEKKQQVFVVVPNKARKYMQALGLKSKNDKIDSQGLALMCAQQKFDLWKPVAKFYYELRLLTRHYQSTQEAKTALLNQHHAIENSGYSSKVVSKQLKNSIDLLKKQIQENKKFIVDHINSNDVVKRKVTQICHIKGVDILTVATIIAETNGFELFKNQSQLTSYAGYDVVENQSGKHVGKTCISKKGNSRIRRILHMPAFCVVTYNETVFVNLYKRVFANTKMKMKAYVAVQKKLLITIYALWKKDQQYQREYNQQETSANEEPRNIFRFNTNDTAFNEVVPLYSSTTQDELQYNESPKALFKLQRS